MERSICTNRVLKKIFGVLMIITMTLGYIPIQESHAKDMEPRNQGHKVLYTSSKCCVSVENPYSDDSLSAEFQNRLGENVSGRVVDGERYYLDGRIYIDEGVDLYINTDFENEVVIKRTIASGGGLYTRNSRGRKWV